jgi:SAM-dependent methyltransferase
MKMANIEKLNKAVDSVLLSINEFKKALNEYSQENSKTEPAILASQNNSPALNDATSLTDFESLKTALMSDKWPEAVNPNLICNPENEEEKLERGRGIIELIIDEDLKDLKFLDYGCGEGQSAFVATEYEPTLSVGYDIKSKDKWKEFQNEKLIITDNYDKVVENGPYDVILLFDVIDHISNESPTYLLNKLKDLLTDTGKIYIRCHPFISKHGTHLYHELNKAYVHLVFTNDEIKTILPDSKYQEKNIGVIYPIKTYRDWFKDTNFNVLNERVYEEKPVPSFFKIPKIAERIMQNTGTNQFPEFQMGLMFIDYTLSKNPKS